MLKCEQYKHPLKHFQVPKVMGISARNASLFCVYFLNLVFRKKTVYLQYLSLAEGQNEVMLWQVNASDIICKTDH